MGGAVCYASHNDSYINSSMSHIITKYTSESASPFITIFNGWHVYTPLAHRVARQDRRSDYCSPVAHSHCHSRRHRGRLTKCDKIVWAWVGEWGGGTGWSAEFQWRSLSITLFLTSNPTAGGRVHSPWIINYCAENYTVIKCECHARYTQGQWGCQRKLFSVGLFGPGDMGQLGRTICRLDGAEKKITLHERKSAVPCKRLNWHVMSLLMAIVMGGMVLAG